MLGKTVSSLMMVTHYFKITQRVAKHQVFLFTVPQLKAFINSSHNRREPHSEGKRGRTAVENYCLHACE